MKIPSWADTIAPSLLLLGWLTSSCYALEVGDKVPRLVLPDKGVTTYSLPNEHDNAPFVIWMPLAGHTPNGLGDKLAHAVDTNGATLIIIPVIGIQHSHDNDDVSVDGNDTDDTSPDHGAASPDSATSATDVPATPPAEAYASATSASATAAPNPAEATSATSATSVSSHDSAENIPPAPQPQDRQAANEDSSPRKSALTPREVPQILEAPKRPLTPQEQYALNSLMDFNEQNPNAHVLFDVEGLALSSYTGAYITDLTPRPNLFIVNRKGLLTWSAFYPGLTTSTLTRAIVSAKSRH